jgi:hypothetical protein
MEMCECVYASDFDRQRVTGKDNNVHEAENGASEEKAAFGGGGFVTTKTSAICVCMRLYDTTVQSCEERRRTGGTHTRAGETQYAKWLQQCLWLRTPGTGKLVW